MLGKVIAPVIEAPFGFYEEKKQAATFIRFRGIVRLISRLLFCKGIFQITMRCGRLRGLRH